MNAGLELAAPVLVVVLLVVAWWRLVAAWAHGPFTEEELGWLRRAP